MDKTLKDFKTYELVEELRTREGVEAIDVPYDKGIEIELQGQETSTLLGPAVVLTIID